MACDAHWVSAWARTFTPPLPAYLVEHPGAGPVLIDTGLHSSVAVKPSENFGRVTVMAFRDIQMEARQALPAQLRNRGLEPSAVKAVVMTHLHVDHASGIAEFPDATFVVSKAEWEAATSQGQTHGYVTRQFDHAFDYRLLDFEGPDAFSFAGFARSFDLFGDGSVRTVYTPGHSLGHMSVVLRTARGEVLVAGDAMYLQRTLEDTHLPHRTEDKHLFRRSLREIRQYATETPAPLLPATTVRRGTADPRLLILFEQRYSLSFPRSSCELCRRLATPCIRLATAGARCTRGHGLERLAYLRRMSIAKPGCATSSRVA